MESGSGPETPSRVAKAMPDAEYEAMRQEILTRNEFRQRTVELTLLSAGAILAAGLKIEDLEPLLLLYPVAVFFLAASWAPQGVAVDDPLWSTRRIPVRRVRTGGRRNRGPRGTSLDRRPDNDRRRTGAAPAPPRVAARSWS